MVKSFFSTDMGELFVGDSSKLIRNASLRKRYEGKCDLIFFSPPYALQKEKSYKNKTADAYVAWLQSFAKPLRKMLSETGSIVIEIGNAWNPGSPTMTTAPIEALLAFKKSAKLHLCQEFIWHNPARLPSPAQWVTVNRIRVKDSFTRIWWLSATEWPKANNRNILQPYSPSMKKLLAKRRYNAGLRPSEHRISKESFFTDNGGAIPPSAMEEHVESDFIRLSNTRVEQAYRDYCEANNLPQHPARMPVELADFFISFLTDAGDLVFDPFAGSNTTGSAAERLGRRWLSMEMSEKFALGSAARFSVNLDDLKREEEPTKSPPDLPSLIEAPTSPSSPPADLPGIPLLDEHVPPIPRRRFAQG